MCLLYCAVCTALVFCIGCNVLTVLQMQIQRAVYGDSSGSSCYRKPRCLLTPTLGLQPVGWMPCPPWPVCTRCAPWSCRTCRVPGCSRWNTYTCQVQAGLGRVGVGQAELGQGSVCDPHSRAHVGDHHVACDPHSRAHVGDHVAFVGYTHSTGK